jgi:hypothetical protein
MRVSSVESVLPIPAAIRASQLGVIVDGVDHVAQQLVLVRARADALAATYEAVGAAEIDGLQRAVAAAMQTVATLRERIIDDTFALGSLDSRAAELRARVTVLITQLHELTAACETVAAPLWPSGRFQSARDVVAFVVAGIARIEPTVHGMEAAERAFHAIGMDADLACFLGAGASTSRLRTVCRAIAALLGIALAPAESATFATPRVARTRAR